MCLQEELILLLSAVIGKFKSSVVIWWDGVSMFWSRSHSIWNRAVGQTQIFVVHVNRIRVSSFGPHPSHGKLLGVLSLFKDSSICYVYFHNISCDIDSSDVWLPLSHLILREQSAVHTRLETLNCRQGNWNWMNIYLNDHHLLQPCQLLTP